MGEESKAQEAPEAQEAPAVEAPPKRPKDKFVKVRGQVLSLRQLLAYAVVIPTGVYKAKTEEGKAGPIAEELASQVVNIDKDEIRAETDSLVVVDRADTAIVIWLLARPGVLSMEADEDTLRYTYCGAEETHHATCKCMNKIECPLCLAEIKESAKKAREFTKAQRAQRASSADKETPA